MHMFVIFPGYALRNLKQISTIVNIFLAPVVQKVDSTIHWIAQLVSLILIRWIVIYAVYSAIQLLNNWGMKYTLSSKTQEHGLCYRYNLDILGYVEVTKEHTTNKIFMLKLMLNCTQFSC